jgi:hypothetical protein
MRERVLVQHEETVPVAALEALLRQRIGWVDCAISPFAAASRNAGLDAMPPKRPALPISVHPEELRLVG